MRRKIRPILLIALLAIISFGSFTIAYGVCAAYKNCWAYYDTGSNPLAGTGPYDPCNSWLKWTFKFHRTAQELGYTVIEYRILEASIRKPAHSDDFFANGDHQIWGWENVGPSSEHTLEIWRIGGSGGHFTNMEAIAQYYAGQAD